MKYACALIAGLLCAPVFAAPPKPVFADHSVASLMDKATARAMLAEGIPARAWKLYPANKWGFVSQVEGGVTQDNTCVVTARVMMLPLTITKSMLLRPEKIATAFDARPNSSSEQCRETARAKLKEAINGVVSSLVKI